MSADAEMEERICAYLRGNGKSTALVISKALSVDKKLVNKHLYDLERSKQVFKTGEQPPVWNLLENHSQKTDEEEEEEEDGAAAAHATGTSREEERVKVLLESGDLKASRIARDLGLETKAVKKKLYSMMEQGHVQKCSRNNTWTLSKGGNEDSDHRLASLSGLSQSFVVIETLGRGGFGCVYKVRHKFDGKIYAVKQVVLTGKADSEAKALAHLDHPNIVRYITCWPGSENWTGERNHLSNTSGSSSDSVIFERSGAEESNDDDYDGEDDEDDIPSGMESLSLNKASAKTSGNYSADELSPSNNRAYLFIQMEFCEGGTLTSWINDRNVMHKQRETVETNKIFYEIISGVEYIHSQKLIHRDLKPDNILFSTNGKVKIGDFGLVAVQENHSKGAINRTVGRGTELYMSPEQGSSKKYNEKTDIFSLGLIWFEMLWKLSTYMERDKLLQNLRNQIFPEGFCTLYVTE
ncbi:Z-DNA binding protein kinase, partial [Clarias magur]